MFVFYVIDRFVNESKYHNSGQNITIPDSNNTIPDSFSIKSCTLQKLLKDSTWFSFMTFLKDTV